MPRTEAERTEDMRRAIAETAAAQRKQMEESGRRPPSQESVERVVANVIERGERQRRK